MYMDESAIKGRVCGMHRHQQTKKFGEDQTQIHGPQSNISTHSLDLIVMIFHKGAHFYRAQSKFIDP